MEAIVYKYLISCQCCEPDIIGALKREFKECIASNRRMRYIKNLTALLKILKKRDNITLDVLESIIYKLKDKSIIDRYLEIRNGASGTRPEPGTSAGIEIPSSSHIRNSHRRINHDLLTYSPSPNERNNQLGIVYDLICDEMDGSRWRDFARHLGFQERDIDELRRQKDIWDCVRYALYYHERNCSNFLWRSKLMEALEKARRKDIQIAVEKKLDEFDITKP